MLDLIKECEDTINKLTEQAKNTEAQLDSLDKTLDFGSVCFELSKDISTKQKLYLY